MGLRMAERLEDMSVAGALKVHIADDGDVVVVCDTDHGMGRVEFCNHLSGGGSSPRTRAALLVLFAAMQQDNEDHVCDTRRGKRGAGVDTV